MKRKKKICKSCKKESFLFSKGLCLSCSKVQNSENYSLKHKGSKRINPISQNQKERLKKYNLLRKEYLEIHPLCEARLENCTYRSEELHHMKDRIGDSLFGPFKALCSSCHRWVTEHSKEAIELGLSISRL